MAQINAAVQENDFNPAKADGFGLRDVVVAGALALGVFVFYAFLSYPGFYPGAWEDAAVAAGLRPAQSVFPGLWRLAAGGLFKTLGIGGAVGALKVLGWLSAAFSAGFAYMFFRQATALVLRSRLLYARRRIIVARFSAGIAALLFGCCEPVWRIAQAFAPDSVLVLMFVLAALLFITFVRTGSVRFVYFAALIAGSMAAESPFGLVAFAAGIVLYYTAVRHADSIQTPFRSIVVAQISRWHITFLFLVGLVATAFLDCYSFAKFQGLAAAGLSGSGSLPQIYASEYFDQLAAAASPTGWLFVLVVLVIPGVCAALLLPRASDEEHFLSYGIGLVFLVAAAMGVSQFAALPGLWVMNWSKICTVSSSMLLVIAYFISAFGILASLLVLGVDSFCRDHNFIAGQHFNAYDEDGEQPEGGEDVYEETGRLTARSKRIREVIAAFLAVLILVAVLPGRFDGRTSVMMATIEDYADTLLSECRGRGMLFSDGAYDSYLELLAKSRGGSLRALSFMGERDHRDTELRLRGMGEGEDRLASAMGADALVRNWLQCDSPKLALSNCQLGFEIWNRLGKPLPLMLALSARPGETDPGFSARAEEDQKRLCDGIFDYYRRYRSVDNNDRSIAMLFETVQWRLARMARFRADAMDVAGNLDGARAQAELADRLDRANASYRALLELMDRFRKESRGRITPREGLRNSLNLANFATAAVYAEVILKNDPQDAEANFAMAMACVGNHQYSLAEDHFKRCLIRTPDDPAVYNNLAMAQLDAGKVEAAAANAAKALELLPWSVEVNDTVRRVEAARKAAAQDRPVPRLKMGDAGSGMRQGN